MKDDPLEAFVLPDDALKAAHDSGAGLSDFAAAPETRGDDRQRYGVFEQIGTGGMGVVFRARDGYLGRDVAMKTLRADRRASPELARRFLHARRVR